MRVGFELESSSGANLSNGVVAITLSALEFTFVAALVPLLFLKYDYLYYPSGPATVLVINIFCCCWTLHVIRDALLPPRNYYRRMVNMGSWTPQCTVAEISSAADPSPRELGQALIRRAAAQGSSSMDVTTPLPTLPYPIHPFERRSPVGPRKYRKGHLVSHNGVIYMAGGSELSAWTTAIPGSWDSRLTAVRHRCSFAYVPCSLGIQYQW